MSSGVSKLQGFWRTFKSYFISGEVKVDVIEQNFEHLQLMELRKSVRDTVLQTEGIPPVSALHVSGILETSKCEAGQPLFVKRVIAVLVTVVS